MKILFVDQSGQLGGAELCLADLAGHYQDCCQVGVFAPGPFPDRLRQQNIKVEILAERSLNFQKQSGIGKAIRSLWQLWPLIYQVSRLSSQHDCIYANTQKALVVSAIASHLSRRPLIYHLHDIVSPDHFSRINRQIIVTSANRAALVIANSEASRAAFIEAGGRADLTHVIYNGFDPAKYQTNPQTRSRLRSELGLVGKFVVGHFSRLSPWKGQHVLIDALQYCPSEVVAVLVGSDLFGEDVYVQQLHQQIATLGLGNRVKLLGFRSDIPELMSACDLIAHTSTAAEPFGRVIAEGMLCGRPVVATAIGGALEIVEHGQTGWLTPPRNIHKLADIIITVYRQPELADVVAKRGQTSVLQRFDTKTIKSQIDQLLKSVIA